MKPIRLVIKGLNSFIEEQTIDFNKLTDKGLFGIFGDTGSGKSTILDGLTLALYGKTSRDSSNFINTQCDEMSVRYEFQIRDKVVKHYIIDRTFKRNKDGRINAKKPTRIIEIVDGKEEMLEEATNAVDKKCIEIIGLKFEDFIRTVVLPQGKFSEFLKLEGKPRREMLERLFSLDQYGDGLARKLGATIKKEKSNMDELSGQLKGYDEISEEIYENKSKDLELKKEQVSKVEKEYKQIFDKYSEGERLWILKQELENHRKNEKALEMEKEIIEEYKLQALKGEKALKVKPYIDAVHRTLEEINITQQHLLKENELFDELVNYKKKVCINFEEAKSNKDNNIPKLKVDENNVNQAIEEDEIKKNLNSQLIDLRKSYKESNDRKDIVDKEILKLKESIENLNKNITLNDKKVEAMNIHEQHRNKVQQGLIIQEKLQQSIKRKDNLDKDVKETSSKIENIKKNIARLEISMEEKKEALTKKNKALEDNSVNCPGNANLLLKMQSNISNFSTTIEKGIKYEKEVENLTNEIVKLSDLISNKKPTKVKLLEEIEDLKKSIEEIKRQNLASILRQGLADGSECPVCGSKEHHYINPEKIHDLDLEAEEKLLITKEQELDAINKDLLTYQINLNSYEEKKNVASNELNNLGKEWKSVNIDALNKEFIKAKDDIDSWTLLNQSLEKDVKIINDELNVIKVQHGKDESSLNENEIAFNKYSLELQKVTEELNNQFTEFNSLKSDLEIDDFLKRDKEIKKIDEERVSLEKLIKENRTQVKSMLEEVENRKKVSNDLVDKLATIRTQGEEKSKQVEEKEQSIKNKIGERTDLFAYKNEILKDIERIEKAFINIEKEKEVIEKRYNECESNVKAYKLQLTKSELRIENEKVKLEEALKAEGFKDKEEAISFLISQDKIKELKDEITKYENKVHELKGKIQEVVNKIDGKEITIEQWSEIKDLKSNKEKELKEFSEDVIRINTELKELKKKLIELKDLLKKKEKLEHKLSLLNDLDGLFKGKRFVEFVAVQQLKYVSLEASKWLKEITSDNYGLEVDEEGKFIIRDYKNGGITRDASTLSGGETFLASLSLALALSAQIQLKGTAPLELFFLDEGFGTLDDNLLEIVMGSLERIHNDRLSVGIISHIESIKNRVPVKLIISPAQAGVSGSKIRIERT